MKQIILAVFVAGIGTASAVSWTYDTKDQWASLFKEECAGDFQSPIAIEKAMAETANFTDFFLMGYDQNMPGSVTNDGHSIKFIPDGGAYIMGLPLESPYKLAQFHLHWGQSPNYMGSEHTLDGTQYAAELHFVHYNAKYANISEAVASGDSNALAVVGVFLDAKLKSIGRDYAFKGVMKAARKVKKPGDSMYVSANLGMFLPQNYTGGFFTYPGSLTTPTCNQIVTWIVLETPITVSMKLIDTLGKLKDKGGKRRRKMKIRDNFRPVQPLNGRTVMYCTPKMHLLAGSPEDFC